MGKQVWAQIKLSKNFNVRVYRLSITLLVCSLMINILIGLLIAIVHLHEPERDYYATSGIAPPVQIQSMSAPNESSQPLLGSDPKTDEVQLVIPQ